MVTLASFAAAGLIAGLFFNCFALIGLCLAVGGAEFMFSFAVGAWQSAGSMMLSLLLLQVGYLGGLSGSVLLFPSKRATLPRRTPN
jgi:hypothetical protein